MEIIQCFHLYSKLFLFHTKLAKSRESIVSWLGTKKLIRYRTLSLNISKAGKLDQKAENSMVLSNFLNGYTCFSFFIFFMLTFCLCFIIIIFFLLFEKSCMVHKKLSRVAQKSMYKKNISERNYLVQQSYVHKIICSNKKIYVTLRRETHVD